MIEARNGPYGTVYRASVRHLSVLLLVVSGLLACESTSSPEVLVHHTVTPEMVTGAAAAALRADGSLTLTLPGTFSGQLSIEEARAQALQFARYVTNNGLLRGVVENERGGYWTDPHLLTLCDDAFFVRSQLGLIHNDSLAGTPILSLLQRFRSQWLIPLCGSAREPQMTIQAAINGNDIRFTNGEPIEPYSFLSTAWYARGVPLNWPHPLSVSAERAVRFAYETFGVRVTEVPELFLRGDVLPSGHYYHPAGSARTCSRWRVVLESNVTIRGTTSLETDTTNVIYVGSLSCGAFDVIPWIHRPVADQPATVLMNYVDETVSPPKNWVLTVVVIAPLRFEIGTRAR
jgi:hypothetical protein